MSWQARAACRDLVTSPDNDLFFEPDSDIPSVKGGDRKVAQLQRKWAALAVCDACPVTKECLAWAVENREQHGIWGGLDEALLPAHVSRVSKESRTLAEIAKGTRCRRGHLRSEAGVYQATKRRECAECKRERSAEERAKLEAGITHCPQGHEYNEQNTWRTVDGRRRCVICRPPAQAGRRRRVA